MGWAKMNLKDIKWKGLQVGVTGTSKGPTEPQKATFLKIVRSWVKGLPATFHDGDCIGVDDWAHCVAFHVWTPSLMLVGHPPNKPDKRAFNAFDVERRPKKYLARDDDIAKEVDILIAIPHEWSEITYSGTWATVRYARRRKKIIIIIWPDGTVRVEDKRDNAGPLFNE